MKVILVPTDFSSSANNAVLYAAELAKEFNAKLILLHSFQIPIPQYDIPTTVISVDELHESNQRFLQREKTKIQRQFNISIDTCTESGFAVEEILKVEKLKRPDMIVMGTRGSGKIQEMFLGSIATEVIKKSKTPVLLIPEKAGFKKPEKIILACDYTAEMDLKNLFFLKDFASKFSSEVYLVNVVSESSLIPEAERGVEEMMIDHFLKEVKCSRHFPENKDFILGMDHFINTHSVAMVTIVPQKHNLIDRVFNESHTKRMAFHTKIPLLALPG